MFSMDEYLEIVKFNLKNIFDPNACEKWKKMMDV